MLDSKLGESQLLQLDSSSLKEASNDFNKSNLIGEGGFGTVFKGYFRSTHIAIKLLTTVNIYYHVYQIKSVHVREIVIVIIMMSDI